MSYEKRAIEAAAKLLESRGYDIWKISPDDFVQIFAVEDESVLACIHVEAKRYDENDPDVFRPLTDKREMMLKFESDMAKFMSKHDWFLDVYMLRPDVIQLSTTNDRALVRHEKSVFSEGYL